jgi:uncharacterized protein
MLIRLDKVRDEPFRWQETLEISVGELGRPELLSLSPVEWSGEVIYAAPDFPLHGEYRYTQTVACSRCLRPVELPVVGSVDLLVTIGQSPEDTGEHQLQLGDLDQHHVPDERLETLPLLVEQLQLEVPMHPLCRPDCQGLCPECGADRNAGPCGCRVEGGDPRWAALAALRDRLPDA